MSSDSSLRVYGKRSLASRRTISNLVEDQEPERIVSPLAKRRKLDATPRMSRTPSPTDSGNGNATDEEDGKANNSTVRLTLPSTRVLDPSESKSKTTLAKNGSGTVAVVTPTPASSPVKLSKRMLARSRTDTSVGSQPSSPSVNLVDRTVSLPNLFPRPESQTDKPGGSFSRSASSVLPLLSPPKPSVTRTYAGQYRSFLAPASVASKDFAPEKDLLADDLESRESYSSLRLRWGVDDLEDDSYPETFPSPTKSQSSISDASPSRPRRGKTTPSTSTRPLSTALNVANPLKSISELRNKGETRRFLDEIGYLFEGMDSKGAIGLRRASALEIVSKYTDSDFVLRAKAADCIIRTWEVFLEAGAGEGRDMVLDMLLVIFIFLLSRDISSLSDLSKRYKDGQNGATGCLSDILFVLLQHYPRECDPLCLVSVDRADYTSSLKGLNIKKEDKSMLRLVWTTFRREFQRTTQPPSISMALMISHVLQSLPPSHLSTSQFPLLLGSFRSVLSSSVDGSNVAKSLATRWRQVPEELGFENLFYHLRLLDLYLLRQWKNSISSPISQESQGQALQPSKEALDTALREWLIDELCALAVATELCSIVDQAFSQKCMDTVLRIFVSLTHSSQLWAEKVLHSPYMLCFLFRTIHTKGIDFHQSNVQRSPQRHVKVKDEDGLDDADPSEDTDDENEQEGELQALDLLCLALGLLTNLVQKVEAAKQLVKATRLNPSCSLKKNACAMTCTCSSPSSGLEILVNLYSQQRVKLESTSVSFDEPFPDASAEADASFLRGHLAVLFGLLMIGSPENQSSIVKALPSPSPAKGRAAERATLSRLVEDARAFVSFYDLVSNNTNGEERSKDSHLAKDVVGFLERKRDEVI